MSGDVAVGWRAIRQSTGNNVMATISIIIFLQESTCLVHNLFWGSHSSASACSHYQLLSMKHNSAIASRLI